MAKVISFIVLLFALSGCMPPPIVEGEVISSKEIGQGVTEHLVRTDSAQIPYYILRTNKNNLQKGAKVVLEIQVNSEAHIIN